MKKYKYKRKLTEEENEHINELSVRSPMSAMRLANMLETRSYRIGGRRIFFTPPKTNERTPQKTKNDPDFKIKFIKKRKSPKIKGKIKLVWPS